MRFTKDATRLAGHGDQMAGRRRIDHDLGSLSNRLSETRCHQFCRVRRIQGRTTPGEVRPSLQFRWLVTSITSALMGNWGSKGRTLARHSALRRWASGFNNVTRAARQLQRRTLLRSLRCRRRDFISTGIVSRACRTWAFLLFCRDIDWKLDCFLFGRQE